MNNLSRLVCFAAACAALCALSVENASAACASKSVKTQMNLSNLFEMPKTAPVVDSQVQSLVAEQRDNDDDKDASIVGLWSITYFVGRSNDIWDQGFEQWHSDGLELNNDNAVPPYLGNVCVGVYKQIGPRTYKLRHMTWNFDVAGHLTGKFELLQTVTVAPNGKTFTGTYVSDSFDLDGKVIPSLHAEGVLSAKRITVD